MMDREFLMTVPDASSVPTALKAELVLKPGESRFIGVPLSDLLYATSGSTFMYKDQLHAKEPGSTLLLIK